MQYANDLVSCLVVLVTGTAIFVARNDIDQNKGRYAALWFWGLWWVCLAVIWRLLGHGQAYYVYLSIDAVGAGGLAGAAYSLLRGSQFEWRDDNLKILAFAVFLLILVTQVLGRFGQENFVWRLMVMSPSIVLAVSTLVFLGIVCLKKLEQGMDEQKKTQIGWSVLVTLLLYAMFQIPAYVCMFNDLGETLERDRKLMEKLLFVGKVLMLLNLIAILLPNTHGPSISTLRKFNYLLIALNVVLGIVGAVSKIVGL